MMTISIFNQMAYRIIHEQELVIGPLAWDEAKKVQGLTVVDSQKGEVQIASNEKEVINGLVSQYEQLFGEASREVCREAVASMIAELPATEIPQSLQ